MKRKALVVDDDEAIRFVLTRALEDIGFEVVTADDGADVPELLVHHTFVLVVMDLYMSGVNGFEMLRQVRRPHHGLLPAPRTPSTVPVLVVSGEGQRATIANARRLGADSYLVKPVDLGVFTRTVGTLVGGSAS